MKKDLLEKIIRDFENSDEVVNILESMESKNGLVVSDRIFRCIDFLAEGDIDKLNQYIELYFKDYRDLIWQAEYDDSEVQKYDFNKSFRQLQL